MLKPKLAVLFGTYDAHHRHPTNKLCHYVGMPLIVFNAVALLDWVLLGHVGGHEVTLAHLLFLAVVGWYATLDLRLAAVTAVWYGLCLPLGWYAPWSVIIGAGIAGWLVQLAGHAIWEKRSPALLTNLKQALVGPLYVAALALRLWPEKTCRHCR